MFPLPPISNGFISHALDNIAMGPSIISIPFKLYIQFNMCFNSQVCFNAEYAHNKRSLPKEVLPSDQLSLFSTLKDQAYILLIQGLEEPIDN